MGLLGIIAYLSSVAVLSPAINLLLIPIAFYRIFLVKRIKVLSLFGIEQKLGFIIMMVALVLSGFVFVLVPTTIENFDRSLIGGVPYIWLIFASVLVGLAFERNDLRAIVILVVLEIIVGILEYTMGVHSFLGVKFLGETQIGDTDLLYYNRVFGLSTNSSVYAFKVLSAFAIVLAFRRHLSRKILICCGVMLLAGFITSFNRTAIIASVIALAFTYSKSIKAMAAFAGLALIAAIGLNITTMFERGQGHIDLSGRDVVFARFLDFIDAHPFFGNACAKVWMWINDGLYHAHNSYLELLASNGVVIGSIFFFGFYLFSIRGRVREASVFLIFSVFQYGILWGLTFNDLVFVGLMSVLFGEKLLERSRRDASSVWLDDGKLEGSR